MKKLLALLLAGVLACSALAGCGGDSDDVGSTTAAGSGAAEDSGSEAADGDFSGTIKIGVICPMSGTAGDGVYMEAACQLLKDGRVPIKEVAYQVGYSSAEQFSRTFRACYAVSPREYRRRMLI